MTVLVRSHDTTPTPTVPPTPSPAATPSTSDSGTVVTAEGATTASRVGSASAPAPVTETMATPTRATAMEATRATAEQTLVAEDAEATAAALSPSVTAGASATLGNGTDAPTLSGDGLRISTARDAAAEVVPKAVADAVASAAAVGVFAGALLTPGLAMQGNRASFALGVMDCGYEDSVDEAFVVFPFQPPMLAPPASVSVSDTRREGFARLHGATLLSSVLLVAVCTAVVVLQRAKAVAAAKRTRDESLPETTSASDGKLLCLAHTGAAAAAYFAPNVLRVATTVLAHSPGAAGAVNALAVFGVAAAVGTCVLAPLWFLFGARPFGAVEQREDAAAAADDDALDVAGGDPLAPQKEEGDASAGVRDFRDRTIGSGFVDAFGAFFDGSRRLAPRLRAAYHVEVLATLLVCLLSGLRPTAHCLGYAIAMLAGHVAYVAYLAWARPLRDRVEVAVVWANAVLQLALLVLVTAIASQPPPATRARLLEALGWEVVLQTVVLLAGAVCYVLHKAYARWAASKKRKATGDADPHSQALLSVPDPVPVAPPAAAASNPLNAGQS